MLPHISDFAKKTHPAQKISVQKNKFQPIKNGLSAYQMSELMVWETTLLTLGLPLQILGPRYPLQKRANRYM